MSTPIVQTASPRPWWKRKWGIATIVVGTLIVLGGIGNAISPTKTGSTSSPSPSPATAKVAPSATAALPASSSAATGVPATAAPTTAKTPEPTPEPTIEPTVTPKPQPIPTIVKTSGRGDKIVKMTAQDEPAVARITNKGSSNFAVVSYAGSAYNDLLVNEIGSYSGWVYVAAGVTRLKITSSGTWTVEVRPITTARAWDGSAALTGKGDAVVLLTDAASGIATIKSKNHSNFAVIAYSPEGDYLDLLVNEIGSYSGEILLPDEDAIVLAIHDVGGSWSISAVSY